MTAEAVPEPTKKRSMLETAGRNAWLLLGIGLVTYVSIQFFLDYRLLTLPLLIAILITTVLRPPAVWLRRHGLGRLLSTLAVFLACLAGAAIIILLLAPSAGGEFADLAENVGEALRELQQLVGSWSIAPTSEEISDAIARPIDELTSDAAALVQRLLEGAMIAGEVLAGFALTLVLTFFLLRDGDRIAEWAIRQFPQHQHDKARRAGSRAYEALAGYVRGSAITGLADAFFIGLGLVILGVPLVFPIVILTFVGAFFPMVGATVAGFVAVLVALVDGGPKLALIVLALVFVVQQLESYLIAPWVMAKAVRLHPIVILSVLTLGGLTAGIIGAFLAVPLTAVAVAVTRAVRDYEMKEHNDPSSKSEGDLEPAQVPDSTTT